MRKYRLLLSDILQAAEDIQKFTHGISRDDFVADEKTRSAVLYKFAVMGEATKLLPEQVRGQYRQRPVMTTGIFQEIQNPPAPSSTRALI